MDRGRPQHERVLHLRLRQLLLVRQPHAQEHPRRALGHDGARRDPKVPRREHDGELDHAVELPAAGVRLLDGVSALRDWLHHAHLPAHHGVLVGAGVPAADRILVHVQCVPVSPRPGGCLLSALAECATQRQGKS